VGHDVHRLHGDDDGIACEMVPWRANRRTRQALTPTLSATTKSPHSPRRALTAVLLIPLPDSLLHMGHVQDQWHDLVTMSWRTYGALLTGQDRCGRCFRHKRAGTCLPPFSMAI